MVLLAMGVVFEMPIFILALTRLGILSTRSCATTAGSATSRRVPRRRAPGRRPVHDLIEILPLWVLYEGSIWLSVLLDRRQARPVADGIPSLRATLGDRWHAEQSRRNRRRPQQGRARSAAKAQPHGRKRHASGGNPNQQLFFSRMRRRAKPMYVILAVLFALTFAFLGVGSGANSGLDQLFSGLNIFGGGGTSVSKAQKESAEASDRPEGLPRPRDRLRVEGRHPERDHALQQYTTLKPKDAARLERARRPPADAGAELRRPSTRPRIRTSSSPRRARPSGPTGKLGDRARHGSDRAGRSDARQPRRPTSTSGRTPRTAAPSLLQGARRSSSRRTRTRSSSSRRPRRRAGRHDDRDRGLQGLSEAQPELVDRGPDPAADQAALAGAGDAAKKKK